MTLKELKDILSSYIDYHSENDVVILLNEKSIGPHACSGIDVVFPRFDWDDGKILICPTNPLCRESRTRDVEKDRVLWHGVIHCPHCEHKVNKKDKYCSNCGQKLGLIKNLDNKD